MDVITHGWYRLGGRSGATRSASSSLLSQSLSCRFVRWQTPPRTPCINGGKKARPPVRVVATCRGARSAQHTCTASTAASLPHQSLRLWRVCHFPSCRSAPIMRKFLPPYVAHERGGVDSYRASVATRRVHPGSGPRTGLELERRQTTNFSASLRLSTPDPTVSDCSGRWHTQH